MTVAVYVTSENDASTLIPWGVRFARADHTDLLVISVRRSKEKIEWSDIDLSPQSENPLHLQIHKTLASQNQDNVVLKQDIAAGVESSDLDRVAIEVTEFQAPVPEQAIIDGLRDRHKITLLLLPLEEPTKKAKRESSSGLYLFDHSPWTRAGRIRADPCSPGDPWWFRH